MDLKEKVIHRKRVLRGVIINVEHWQVELPDGREALREVVVHVGAAAVVPVTQDEQVIMVRQWRTAFGEAMLEIPAGKLDAAEENPLDCAMRELKEETGYTADTWTPLTNTVMSPGYLTEKIGIYLAQGLHQGKPKLDDGEFLEVLQMPLREALASVMTGAIQDAKTIVGLLMAARQLGIH